GIVAQREVEFLERQNDLVYQRGVTALVRQIFVNCLKGQKPPLLCRLHERPHSVVKSMHDWLLAWCEKRVVKPVQSCGRCSGNPGSGFAAEHASAVSGSRWCECSMFLPAKREWSTEKQCTFGDLAGAGCTCANADLCTCDLSRSGWLAGSAGGT